MNNIISLVLLELKFILKSKFIWVGISVAFFYSVAIFLNFELTNKSADPNSFYSFFNDISFYVLAILAAVHLSKEFELKTSRIIFSSGISTPTLLLIKLMSLLLLSLFWSIFHRLLANLLEMINLSSYSTSFLTHDLGKTIFIYMLCITFICSVAFLVTAVTFKRMTTVITVILIFTFERFIRGMLLLFASNNILERLLKLSPFKIAFESLEYAQINVYEAFMLFIFSIGLFVFTNLILLKKDLP